MTGNMDSLPTTIVHEEVLITVKTYPTLSDKYGELVCTAGLRKDGSWIRLYPIPFRLQESEQQYKKYQWIELDVVKRDSKQDPRRESYSPVCPGEIKLGEFLEPSDPRRRETVHKSVIYTKLSDLTDGVKKERASLATFRPSRVLEVNFEKCDREWNEDKFKRATQSVRQGTFFDSDSVAALRKSFQLAQKIPYRFLYKYEDEERRRPIKGMIEDWELGQLFLNCREKYGEERAIKMTIEKYESFITNQDLLFFLGTTKQWHAVSDNPYIVIGVYRQSPKMKDVLPKEKQPTLF